MRSGRRLVGLWLLLLAPLTAQAWWNPDFKQRTQVILNTGAAGVPVAETLNGMAVPVRLHSGNFDFLGALPDGADLRVVAADDKTPLRYRIERFDSSAELAVLWVQWPTVLPATDKNLVYVYAGNPKAAAEAAVDVADAGAVATVRFAATEQPMLAAAAAALEANGLIGGAARFDAGSRAAELPPNPNLRAAAGAPYSVSLWIRPTGTAGTLLAQGPLSLALDGSRVVARLAGVQVAGGNLPPSTWAHLGLSLGGGKLRLYVDGTPAGDADVPPATPAIEGPVRIGGGYAGLVDELQIATTMRSADWMRFVRAAQGADAKLVASQTQNAGEASAGEGGHGGYIGVLVKNLTVDAWVVIVILGLMFLVALWVMVAKTALVLRTDRGNQAFLLGFRDAADVMAAGGPEQHAESSIARLYAAGMQQLRNRRVGEPGSARLSGASLDAVKASIDAGLVRENHKLNALMVLLTIAISGGPFLGLLGTVVGVMITFAAIAAAGDVNVNAIAPGIAAALLATVAGLAVAIPALFGYNWLASRIKNISADMQIFVDEFVTRVAESHGER